MSTFINASDFNPSSFVIGENRNEFLTPRYIADIMVDLAIKHGFKGGKVLEPSCGRGVFFESLIDKGFSKDLYGIEINKENLKYIPKEVTVINDYFEHAFLPSSYLTSLKRNAYTLPNDFQLVIGNPPYDYYDNAYPFPNTPLSYNERIRYEGLFILLSSNVLKSGGILVFIVNSLWMRNDNKYNGQKELIHESGLELIDGYRLPNNIFSKSDTRKTSIATDILIFKKL